MLRPVVPVEDDWQAQLLSHRRFSLKNRTWGMGEVRISGLLRYHKMLNLGKCVRRRSCLSLYARCGRLGTLPRILRYRIWWSIEKKVCALEKWSLRNRRIAVSASTK